MSVADQKYKDLIKDIHNTGTWDSDKDVRANYADGTPAYCKSVFGKQVVFEEDELPLLTCKKVFTKTAIKEMMLFWIKQTVRKSDFEDDSVNIWNEWFLSDGTLGKSYAYQFESNPVKEIVKVSEKLGSVEDHVPFYSSGVVIPHHTFSRSGTIIENHRYGNYTILGKDLDGERYVIQFNKTGNMYSVNRSDAIGGYVKDFYQKVGYFKHGCIGDLSNVRNLSKKQLCKLKQVWINMLSRCYNPNAKDYKNYGAKGVFVSNDWQCFEFFIRDIKELPQYFLAKKDDFKGWNLDKDYFSSNCYSKLTCVFLKKSENIQYVNSKPFLVSGSIVNDLFISQGEAALRLGVDSSSVSAVLLGKYSKLKSHTFKYVDDDFTYRYKISKNQVVKLLSEIKHNPTSKRLLTSFWNFDDVEDKALQECAFQTQWNVRGDKLDLILTQRSGDLGLGVPFNWFQYKVLQMIVAKCTGYKAGRFIHQIGNLHYYDRHEKTLLSQLELREYDQPNVILNFNHSNFFEVTHDDVSVVNYVCGEYLPMEVAI